MPILSNFPAGAKQTIDELGAQSKIAASGILKGDGSGGVTAAEAGTDYVEPQSFTSHVSDTTVHVTAEERAAWNEKTPASDTTPSAPGTASAGTEEAYARGDHVHPKEVSNTDRAEWDANTTARHSHDNKAVLDAITGQVTADKLNDPDHVTDLVQYEAFQKAAQSILQSIPEATFSLPKAAGTAAAGTETAYARGDHVHPKEVSDADRAAWNGKQDTSTAITTANIANQNVNKAKYATDDVAVGTPGLRNEKFVSTETTPTVNGQICWTYG